MQQTAVDCQTHCIEISMALSIHSIKLCGVPRWPFFYITNWNRFHFLLSCEKSCLKRKQFIWILLRITQTINWGRKKKSISTSFTHNSLSFFLSFLLTLSFSSLSQVHTHSLSLSVYLSILSISISLCVCESVHNQFTFFSISQHLFLNKGSADGKSDRAATLLS